ncbi:universal stress protein [Azospirillum halopraeferens]|uniref:universal stress protein n=1 Tax=Azospirillum halopraeferens TaxID=34010 RepID=UPI0004912771|nr:universal stress protein [Azospirillum halopraeferens]
MALKNILVHLDDGERSAERLDLAVRLAGVHGARLTGLFAQSETLGPGLVARRPSDRLVDAAERAKAAFTARTAEAGVPAKWWQLAHGEYGHVIGETVICSRYCDLAVLGQHDPEAPARVPSQLTEEVILHAGRPVLAVPYAGTFAHVGHRVVVAWNASREAARAINDAIPLMQGAKSVLVLALHGHHGTGEKGPVPQVDIVDHLAAHGIAATQERMTVEDMMPMDAVLNRISDEGADLLVMGGFGGYGSGPFGLFGRGANTRHILRQMTVPVLFSH